jgi:hypothetical protein
MQKREKAAGARHAEHEHCSCHERPRGQLIDP